MTERLSVAPTDDLPKWLRERNEVVSPTCLGGWFEPSSTWEQGGTLRLWAQRSNEHMVVDEEATKALFEFFGLTPRAHEWETGISLSMNEGVPLLMRVVEGEAWDLLCPSLLLWANALRLGLKIVESGDMVAFAAPADSPWPKVLHSLYQLSNAETQEWLPWKAEPQLFLASWIPVWKQPFPRALRRVYVSRVEVLRKEMSSLIEKAGKVRMGKGTPTTLHGAQAEGQRVHPLPDEALDSVLDEALDAWLCICVDWWARKVLAPPVLSFEETTKSPYQVPYRGEQDMLVAWTEALFSKGLFGRFEADAWLVWRTLRQFLLDSGWRNEWLQDKSGKEYYHIDLELQPPSGPAVSTGDWRLVYHIAHNHWPISAPLRAWWQSPKREWQIGHDVLVHPDEWILPLIYQMAAVFAPIGQELAKPGPSGCSVPSHQVYEFVTDVLPRLAELGCTFRIPDLTEEAEANIRIRVQVKRVMGKNNKNSSLSGHRSMGLFDADQLVAFDWTVVVGDETLSKAEFDAMVERNAPFVQIGGSWKLLPVQAILEQARLLESAAKPGTMNLIQLSRALLMSEAPNTEDFVRMEMDMGDEVDTGISRAIEMLHHAHQPEILEVPRGFQGVLRQYQQFGYSWLVHLRSLGCGGCLADDMGLGKTIQVIAYLLHLLEAGKSSGPHLLLCPTSLLQNWKSELARFAPNLRVYIHHGSTRNDGLQDETLRAAGQSSAAQGDVASSSALQGNALQGNAVSGIVSPLLRATNEYHLVITTYGTVVRDEEQFSEIPWDVVIADEAQNIKNHETKQAKAAQGLMARHRIALTGTPVENRLEDLWSLFQFANPGYLGSLAWFRRTFAGPIASRPDAPSARRLHGLLRPVLLRRRKTEPEIRVELPEKWEVSEYAGLTSEQASLYQSVLNRLFGQMEEGGQGSGDGNRMSAMARRGHILSALVRLKQVCDHPCLLLGGQGDTVRSGKLGLLIDILRDVVEDGEAALVFTQFRDMGELLCDVMEKEFGARPRFLHGGLSATARGQIVDEFQSGVDPSPILVLSLKAGGVGLNLTRANHVFHYDRWWNPAVEDQATDRAFRIGQKRDVQVHRLICSGTLEERIDSLIQSKRAVSSAVVGESEGWVTELDDNELRQLFALDADASVREGAYE